MADSNWLLCPECEVEFHVLIDGGSPPSYCPNCGSELPVIVDEEYFDEEEGFTYDDD